MEKITIKTDYITLGQLLKITDIISTGGEAKFFLSNDNNKVLVNNEEDYRRGRKLYPNDEVVINNKSYQIIK